jgi:hypothetical protein
MARLQLPDNRWIYADLPQVGFSFFPSPANADT